MKFFKVLFPVLFIAACVEGPETTSQAKYTYGSPFWDCNEQKCLISLEVSNPPKMVQTINFEFTVTYKGDSTSIENQSIQFNKEEDLVLVFELNTDIKIENVTVKGLDCED